MNLDSFLYDDKNISFTSKDNGEFVMELTTTTPNLISKIQVPTWRDSDQNDIVWYDAQKVNDTTYRVVMNIANHKHHIGQYNLHVYAMLKNGIQHFVCADTQEVTVTNYTYIENSGKTRRKTGVRAD